MSTSPEKLLSQKFGQEIRERRLKLGLGQEKLGALSDSSRETISTIEKGHIPRVALIYRLARALGTNLWELLPKDVSDLGTDPGGLGTESESYPRGLL